MHDTVHGGAGITLDARSSVGSLADTQATSSAAESGRHRGWFLDELRVARFATHSKTIDWT